MQHIFSECLLQKAGKHLGEGEINHKVGFGASTCAKYFWWKRWEIIYLHDLETDIYSNIIWMLWKKIISPILPVIRGKKGKLYIYIYSRKVHLILSLHSSQKTAQRKNEENIWCLLSVSHHYCFFTLCHHPTNSKWVWISPCWKRKEKTG